MVLCCVCKEAADINNEDIEQIGHDAQTVKWKHRKCRIEENIND